MSESLSSNTTLSHYRIVSKIGAGGMGEVYLAEDTKLDRRVALKILPQEFAKDAGRMDRFVREAKSASALNHPNIITIYEIGETDSMHFIATEYIQGETLHTLLNHGPLDLKPTLDIAIQVASALDAAHRAGITHRDIKPDNLMVRPDGLVKVLDFGIAKLSERTPESIDKEAATLIRPQGTSPDMIVGTASYMSPEQARGRLVDARSDIFSFGIVFYEMLSGKRAFAGENSLDVIGAILHKEPTSLTQVLPDLPTEIERIINKTLRKDRDERYQTTRDLLIDLKDAKQELEFQAKLERTPAAHREERNTHAIPASTTDSPQPPGSRAELITQQVKNHKIGVGVGSLVLLTLLVPGVWYVFIHSSTDNSPFFRRPGATTAGAKSVSSAAYDDYVRGKVMAERENPGDNQTAITLLEQAVRADPSFAAAWAELACAYNSKTFYFAPEADKKKLTIDAEVAVAKALALDENLAEGHYARGLILWTKANRFPHEQAIQSLKHAIALNPNLDDAHNTLGVIYFHIGLLDEAWAETEKALEIKPSNTNARFRFGVISIYRAKFEEALSVFKSIPQEVNPSLVDRNMATALFHLGRMDEASGVAEEYLKNYSDEGGSATSVKAMLLAKAGKERDAEESIQQAIKIGKSFGHFHHTAYNIASAYALLNRHAEAIKWLEEAADDGFPCYPWFENDSTLSSLRKDESFITFMGKLRQQWEHYKSTL